MDPSYDGKPSMISETTWNRPNRYRSEAPLYFAAYGALQDSDAIVHFAFDRRRWSVKPGFFMQPWTLMSPAMMGQFPAAALIYRKGLVATGDLLVDLNLKLDDLLDLQGTPLPQDAALDELRLKDVPQGTALKPGNVIDPLVHFAGRTNVNFTTGGAKQLRTCSPSSTASTGRHQHHRRARLDYGKGVLTINAPAAQGISGALGEAGKTELEDLTISSKLELGHIVAVSLDGKPLATSRRILLQAMSEEKATDFRTEPAGDGVKRIVSIGHDPWLVHEIERHGPIQTARRREPRSFCLGPQRLHPNPRRPRRFDHATADNDILFGTPSLGENSDLRDRNRDRRRWCVFVPRAGRWRSPTHTQRGFAH